MGDLFHCINTNDHLVCAEIYIFNSRIQVQNNLENAHMGYYKNRTKKSSPTIKILVQIGERCSNTYTQGCPKFTPFSSFRMSQKEAFRFKRKKIKKFILTECHI